MFFQPAQEPVISVEKYGHGIAIAFAVTYLYIDGVLDFVSRQAERVVDEMFSV